MTKKVDLHCDTVLALYEKKLNNEEDSLLHNDLHVDIEKMRGGDYLLQNFALFTDYKAKEGAKNRAEALYDEFSKLMKENEDSIRQVFSYHDIEKNQKDGKLSALLTLEEGDVMDGNLDELEKWYDRGVRMIALTWNYPNRIGYPNMSMDNQEDWKTPPALRVPNTKNGLTDFGKAYVKKMEELGIIPDVSHLSDKGFWDILENTEGPVVASHSNARALCSVPRNLSDEMIQALDKRGGVMGMNFCADFLNNRGDNYTSIEDIVRHILYIKSIASIDVIALGTDFDGITSRLEMKNAYGMKELETALHKAGLTQDEIEKICFKNALRIYKKVLK